MSFRVYCRVLSASALLSISALASQVAAETVVKIDDVRNELLKASLPKPKGQGEDPTAQKISNEDLEKAEKRLKAAEARLIGKQQTASAGTNPRLPNEDLEQIAGSESSGTLTEKPLPKSVDKSKPVVASSIIKESKVAEAPKSAPLTAEQRGSVDVDKVLTALDKASEAAPTNALVAGSPQTPPVDPKVDELQKRNQELEQELHISQEKANTISKELDETRNRLMIAETQIERLSSIIESRGGSLPARSTTGAVNSQKAANESGVRPAPPLYKSRVEESAPDMQIATVIVDKAHLRTGPGRENSPLMAITKGTRLAVETRNGDWYRVVAPSGVRAWVSSDVVAFGIDPRMNLNQAGRVKGFDSSSEE